MTRYALYFTPRPDSLLAEAAAGWFGRDAENLELPLQVPEGLSEKRFKELTSSPYHYGFHGTLKPPFRLSESCIEQQLVEEIYRFSQRKLRFSIDMLEVAWIDRFLCLRPVDGSDRLNRMAHQIVREFDQFRKPLTDVELQKRRAKGLTPEQDNLLLRWGYPYVFEEFRFHLTLTGEIADGQQRSLLEEEARKRFPPNILQHIPFDGIALFTEEQGKPMTQVDFFPFQG